MHSDERIFVSSYTANFDGKGWIVEVHNTGDFYEMTPACIDAIRSLEQGDALEDIQNNLKIKYPDEEIDIYDFVAQLQDIGLLDFKGQTAAAGDPAETGTDPGLLPANRWASALFNKYTEMVYAAFFIVNIVLFLANGQLFPRYRDLFVFDAMGLNTILWLGASLLVMVHETGHFLAARAEGIGAKLGIGNRLFLIVLETDMSRIWRLPAARRYLLYLGGICFDQTLLSVTLILRISFPDVHPLSGILATASYFLVLTTVYQCLFFMKTDLYYVVENATGCYNLMENGKAWLSGLFNGRNQTRMTGFGAKERAVVRLYGVFYALGTAFAVLIFLFYIGPQMVFAGLTAFRHLAGPQTGWQRWDGALVLMEIAAAATIPLYTSSKNRKLSRTEGKKSRF